MDSYNCILLLVFKYEQTKCRTNPVFRLRNSLSDVIYSKTVVFSQIYVQCSRKCFNGGVSFVTYHVHVYKIL